MKKYEYKSHIAGPDYMIRIRAHTHTGIVSCVGSVVMWLRRHSDNGRLVVAHDSSITPTGRVVSPSQMIKLKRGLFAIHVPDDTDEAVMAKLVTATKLAPFKRLLPKGSVIRKVL